jgi:hypothetical protein
MSNDQGYREEMRARMRRSWRLAYLSPAEDALDARLLLVAKEIDPDSWRVKNFHNRRFNALEAAARVRTLPPEIMPTPILEPAIASEVEVKAWPAFVVYPDAPAPTLIDRLVAIMSPRIRRTARWAN